MVPSGADIILEVTDTGTGNFFFISLLQKEIPHTEMGQLVSICDLNIVQTHRIKTNQTSFFFLILKALRESNPTNRKPTHQFWYKSV